MATTAPAFEDQRMSVGRVFARAIAAVRTNPLVIISLALVIGALPGLLMTYVFSVAAADLQAEGATSAFFGAMVVSMIVSMVIGSLVQGALTRATVEASEGRKATFGESLGAALRVVLPLIGLGILFSLGVALGFVLLIVPGVILLLMWSVAVPALVIEREGVFRAFARSRQLTSGSRWKILAVFVVLLVAYWLLSALVGIVGLAAYAPTDTSGLSVSALLGTVLTGTIFNAAWGTIQPSLYVELRQSKEGSSAERLAEVFA